ncbi:methionine ABC transporter ATP-binding protein [Inconstantimicrobium porci]|uniref:methionine ABC transporter ATP-binding protein n=1 Tax=Inconstantimicrobium porci TaxID=2652291 RepID=UPI003899CB57
MIELKNVSKTFAKGKEHVKAVDNVSLSIKDGEIYGIIGFSGAGKSTLVRCINLLEKPDCGEVIVDNIDLMKLKEKELRKVRQHIGMIFQHFNLMKSRTVFDNVAYPLRHTGLSKEDIKEKVSSLLNLVELEDKAASYPSQLSGGQKQRVAIARSLANNPDILLCDEATSALDPQTTLSILKLLKSVNKKLNITIVVITHEMEVIKEICDTVAVVEDGHVVEQGSVFDVFSDPKQQITKKFISTTSNIQNIYELINQNESIVQLKENSKILKLKYLKDSTSEAIIQTS